MKKPALLIAVVLLTLFVAPAMFADTMSGWITDSHCGAKGANEGHKSCALRCAENDGRFVFYNSADQKIYDLDKQDLAKEHLGGEVEVTGDVDGASIKVTSIEFKNK